MMGPKDSAKVKVLALDLANTSYIPEWCDTLSTTHPEKSGERKRDRETEDRDRENQREIEAWDRD